MKLLCTLFLSFVLMSSVAFAQKQDNKPQASNFDEFGEASNGDIKARIDGFFIELLNTSGTQGYVVNYGLDRDVARREQFLRNYLLMRNFDTSKITLVKGGILKKIKTELWIVPKGAEPPKLIPTPKIFAEIGRATNQKIKKLMEEFDNTLQNEPTATGYLINYGMASDIAVRERQIRNSLSLRRFPADRIVIVNGGRAKVLKTVFWVVPEGAEPLNVSNDKKADLPKAVKFEEFGLVSIGELRYYTDKFFLELANNPDARGYIINYGKTRLVLNRERVLRGRINLRRINAARIKLIRGGNKKEFTTELWIVPQGAEPPTS